MKKEHLFIFFFSISSSCFSMLPVGRVDYKKEFNKIIVPALESLVIGTPLTKHQSSQLEKLDDDSVKEYMQTNPLSLEDGTAVSNVDELMKKIGESDWGVLDTPPLARKSRSPNSQGLTLANGQIANNQPKQSIAKNSSGIRNADYPNRAIAL